MSKSSYFQLDNRLKLCADFVRNGAKLADIGTDHAYLPVCLCRIGRCPSAIAADINPDPLSRGRTTVANAGMQSQIELRLSNGLQKISADEVDDIVIAGMGGELIAKILEECSFSKNSSKNFILQPMTKSELLIEWLCKNGFEIIKQDCCIASKKCYTVLLVKYTGKIIARDESFYYLAKLNPKENETHLLFLQSHINRLLKQAKGDVRFAMLAEKLKNSI
jgi:tRNA (adenine22-N1)-methyltransferase